MTSYILLDALFCVSWNISEYQHGWYLLCYVASNWMKYTKMESNLGINHCPALNSREPVGTVSWVLNSRVCMLWLVLLVTLLRKKKRASFIFSPKACILCPLCFPPVNLFTWREKFYLRVFLFSLNDCLIFFFNSLMSCLGLPASDRLLQIWFWTSWRFSIWRLQSEYLPDYLWWNHQYTKAGRNENWFKNYSGQGERKAVAIRKKAKGNNSEITIWKIKMGRFRVNGSSNNLFLKYIVHVLICFLMTYSLSKVGYFLSY